MLSNATTPFGGHLVLHASWTTTLDNNSQAAPPWHLLLRTRASHPYGGRESPSRCSWSRGAASRCLHAKCQHRGVEVERGIVCTQARARQECFCTLSYRLVMQWGPERSALLESVRARELRPQHRCLSYTRHAAPQWLRKSTSAESWRLRTCAHRLL